MVPRIVLVTKFCICCLIAGCAEQTNVQPRPPGSTHEASTDDSLTQSKQAPPSRKPLNGDGPGKIPLSPDGKQVERLIGQLVNVAEPGFGYSGYFSGSEFLPYANTGEIGTAVIGATHRARSETLRKIVERGADAIPALLNHIADDRELKMKPMSGMMWMSFSDEYDFNRRTRKTAPVGVNRDDFLSGEKHPTRHSLTVGDLCFVALGQIVNRAFSATRYQPTGGLIVNSPTYSKRLRDAVTKDWKALTRETHEQLLIADFKTPDHEGRRTGAYLRLAFYYPESVEPLVLEELTKPRFDVFKVETLCRDKLYKTADKTKRKQIYDKFIRDYGNVYSIGIMDQLFDYLDTLEAHEKGQISPPLTRFSTQPRELLIELFDKPAEVKSSDRPFVDSASESERARLIRTLTHDKSRKIGDAVKRQFLQKPHDDYLAPACLVCLANRGYADFLVEQLDQVKLAETKTNYLHLKYIEAISTSNEKAVQTKLFGIVKTTKNDDYFMAALPGLDQSHDPMILELAKKILDGLPKETDQGGKMLEMIGKRFPAKAKGIYQGFLRAGSARRAETMCGVLWYGNPMSKDILAPLLNDKRKLEGFSIPMRVCDRAAQAISHTTDKIEFDSDWSVKRKDEVIVKLIQYCKQAPK